MQLDLRGLEMWIHQLNCDTLNLEALAKIEFTGWQKMEPFGSFDHVHMPTCESCLHGKMTKSPFTGKGERVTELLGLIH
jgi:hypothetical protein